VIIMYRGIFRISNSATLVRSSLLETGYGFPKIKTSYKRDAKCRRLLSTQTDKSNGNGKESSKVSNSSGGVGDNPDISSSSGFGSSRFYTAKDFQNAYSDIERSVMSKINEENSTRFRAILVGGTLFILWIGSVFGDDIKKSLIDSTSSIATETLENESLKVQTQELASAVVQTVLNDPEVTSKASNFLQNAAQTPETQKALLDLTLHVLQHPDTIVEVVKLGKELVARLADDQETVNQLGSLVAKAFTTPELQNSAINLIVYLSENTDVIKAVEELAVKVVATQDVVDATNQLMNDSAQSVMEDDQILLRSKDFLAEVVGDDRLQREGGNALWNTVTHAVKPSFYRVLGGLLAGTSVIVLQCLFSPF